MFGGSRSRSFSHGRARAYAHPLVFEGVAILFNDRVGQNLARNALDFRLSVGFGETAIQTDLEVLSLPNALQPLKAHFVQRALDSLALRIQDTFFERDVNVGSHGRNIIRQLRAGVTVGQVTSGQRFWRRDRRVRLPASA